MKLGGARGRATQDHHRHGGGWGFIRTLRLDERRTCLCDPPFDPSRMLPNLSAENSYVHMAEGKDPSW